MLVPSATEGLIVHQLLCKRPSHHPSPMPSHSDQHRRLLLTRALLACAGGREIADPSGGNPLFGMAQQMANFVYLVADAATKQAAVVDACWDCAGVAKIAEGLGLTITGALYTHKHFDHGGGAVPERMATGPGGSKIMLEGAQTMAALGAEVFACAADVPDLSSATGLAAVTPLEEGTVLHIGGHAVTTLHTPGHTPGSACFQVRMAFFPLAKLCKPLHIPRIRLHCTAGRRLPVHGRLPLHRQLRPR